MTPTPPPAAIVAPALLPGHAVDLSRIASALRSVETADRRHPSRGRHGEGGAYQMKREAWESVTDLPFEDSDDPELAQTVCWLYLWHLQLALERNGLTATPEAIIGAFKLGLRDFLAGRATPAQLDAIRRASRLYYASLVQPGDTP